jgi:fimbrial isopeptide formation D2 family protein
VIHRNTRQKSILRKRNRLFGLGFVLLSLPLLAAFFSTRPPKTQAAPFVSCDTYGILFQYPGGTNTQVHHIDMVTGADSQPSGSPIANRTINAIGYNVKDKFVYGWDDTQDTLVRIHNDHTAQNLTISGYAGPTSGIIIGDVDDNGHYWFIAGSDWYQVDLTAATPTLLNTGSAAGIVGSAGADWAFIPGTDSLYRIMQDAGTTASLWAFNRTSHSWSNLGTLAGITGTDRTMGAFYADADGFLYGSSNPTGNIWRVNVSAVTAALFAIGPSSSSNDGARCAEASIPIDFGDAPSSYDTLLTDDGPRHSVVGYNDSTKTGLLMLGKKVDAETDGFPGTTAKGDDDDDIDDERGVTHIVATPGTPTALNVPIYVSNVSSQPATLAGWVDLDNDGAFEAGERVTQTLPANTSGTYELNFPATTFTTNTYSRFRVFQGSVANPLPTGSATGGEVEDVLVQVGTYNVSKTANPTEGSTVGSGETVTYTLNIQNTGATALTNLKIDDDLRDVLDDATLTGGPTVNPTSAGDATVNDSVLEFTGDISVGQTVTVTYAVTIKDTGSLGNNALNNKVLATHSTDCHPDVDGTSTTVSHPNCNTTHAVEGLANTGNNIWLIFAVIGGLFGSSALAFYIAKRWAPVTSQK